MDTVYAEEILTSNGFIKKSKEDFQKNMIEYRDKGFKSQQMFNGFAEKIEECVKNFIGLTNKRYCVIVDCESVEIDLWGWND